MIRVDDTRVRHELQATRSNEPPEPCGPGGPELVAGARYKAIRDAMGRRLMRHWSLPRNGRRISNQSETVP